MSYVIAVENGEGEFKCNLFIADLEPKTITEAIEHEVWASQLSFKGDKRNFVPLAWRIGAADILDTSQKVIVGRWGHMTGLEMYDEPKPY